MEKKHQTNTIALVINNLENERLCDFLVSFKISFDFLLKSFKYSIWNDEDPLNFVIGKKNHILWCVPTIYIALTNIINKEMFL